MIFEVTILGSNSAIPAHGRHPTSQVLNHNDKLFLIDCGEGTQMQLSNYSIKRSKINHIFISHLHGDHYYGLIGLLTSYHLLKRTEPLHIFGPKGLKEIIDLNFKYSDTRLVYPLTMHETGSENPEMIFENDQLSVTTIVMKHRIPCCGFLFREKKQQRRIIPGKIEKYQIPFSQIGDLKNGGDFQTADRLIPNNEVTSDPPLSRTYAFCSDTLFHEAIAPQVKEADLMYHECTFMEDSRERAQLTFHSTTLQAAEIAKKARVKKLLLGHFSAKYDNLSLLLDEARTIFPDTELAIEGKTFKVSDTI